MTQENDPIVKAVAAISLALVGVVLVWWFGSWQLVVGVFFIVWANNIK